MRIRKAGKVRDRLWFFGREESGIYLIEGHDESMIVSGGLSYIVPEVLGQFEEFKIDEGKITKLLILHAHFDHVGIVPFFKRRHPNLEIYASSRAWEILKMPKAMDTINEYNVFTMNSMELYEACSHYDLLWRHNEVSGQTVSEGNIIDLGGVEVRIFETPGHSSCSISAWVPAWKALFASDGGGIPYNQTIIPSGNSNFTKFQQSLEKLKDLEVEYVCADHYGYVVGEEAGRYIGRAIELAGARRAKMEEAYRRTRDIDTAAQELVEAFFKENPGYIIRREIYEGVQRQMLRHVAKIIDQHG
jgi:glyoxylase-like metal-dependent hydrolase (beta-lactamase superfamily II)